MATTLHTLDITDRIRVEYAFTPAVIGLRDEDAPQEDVGAESAVVDILKITFDGTELPVVDMEMPAWEYIIFDLHMEKERSNDAQLEIEFNPANLIAAHDFVQEAEIDVEAEAGLRRLFIRYKYDSRTEQVTIVGVDGIDFDAESTKDYKRYYTAGMLAYIKARLAGGEQSTWDKAFEDAYNTEYENHAEYMNVMQEH